MPLDPRNASKQARISAKHWEMYVIKMYKLDADEYTQNNVDLASGRDIWERHIAETHGRDICERHLRRVWETEGSGSEASYQE